MKKRGKIIENYMELAILLNFIAFFAIRDIVPLFWLFQVFFLVSMFMYIRGKKLNFKYVFYCMMFLSWTVLSFLWASSTSHAIKFLKEMGQISVLCSALSFYCTDNEKIMKVLRLMIYSLIITVIYLIIKTPLSEWRSIYYFEGSVASSEGRLGYTIGVHPNEMGFVCAMGCLLYFYYLTSKNSKKLFGLLMFLIFVVLILFTKSRNSILFSLATVSLYWIFSKERKNNKIFIRLFIIAIVIMIGLWAVFNIQSLYNLVGYRFEGLLGIFNSDVKVDASTMGRRTLIEVGIRIIKDYPLIGIGAGNYANVAYQYYGIWREVYAHSNFIEICADLGIIGFLIYYIPRIWCARTLYKKIKTVDVVYTKMYVLLFAFCFTNILFDYTSISYNKETVQFLFLLCYCAATLPDNTTKKLRKKPAEEM